MNDLYCMYRSGHAYIFQIQTTEFSNKAIIVTDHFGDDCYIAVPGSVVMHKDGAFYKKDENLDQYLFTTEEAQTVLPETFFDLSYKRIPVV